MSEPITITDEAKELYDIFAPNGVYGTFDSLPDALKQRWENLIKHLQSSRDNTIAEKDKEIERLEREYSCFVSAMVGGLYGLSTHPSDTPLNGCLISEASKQKLNSIYQQALKERQAIENSKSKIIIQSEDK